MKLGLSHKGPRLRMQSLIGCELPVEDLALIDKIEIQIGKVDNHMRVVMLEIITKRIIKRIHSYWLSNRKRRDYNNKRKNN
jgi:hypothetical protein